MTYTSDNPSIATVDENGCIKAISNGYCNITVKTVDGGYEKVIELNVRKELTSEELSFSDTLNKTNNYISGFDVNNLYVSNIKNLITTNYEILIYNKDNELLTDNNKIGTGSYIRIVEDVDGIYNILTEFTLILYGDVNGDGNINSVDLLVLQRHILEIELLENSFLVSGNINKNGNNPSSLDCLLIQRHILGLSYITQ